MPRELPVRDIMTREVVTLHPEESIQDALRVLAQHGISGAPVVDADDRLVGLLDDSDLLVADARLHGPTMIEILGAYLPLPGEQRRFNEELRHALGRTVADMMQSDPPSLPEAAQVEDAATIMVERHVSRVPIVGPDGKVIGIVTRGDIVAAMGRR
jgi:CBS domain-containing protein